MLLNEAVVTWLTGQTSSTRRMYGGGGEGGGGIIY